MAKDPRIDHQKSIVRSPLTAALRDYPAGSITLEPGDGLWWNPATAGDPVVFEAGGLSFTVDRLRFLSSIEDDTSASTALVST